MCTCCKSCGAKPTVSENRLDNAKRDTYNYAQRTGRARSFAVELYSQSYQSSLSQQHATRQHQSIMVSALKEAEKCIKEGKTDEGHRLLRSATSFTNQFAVSVPHGIRVGEARIRDVAKYTTSSEEGWTHLEPQRPERSIAQSASICSPPLRDDLQIIYYSPTIHGVDDRFLRCTQRNSHQWLRHPQEQQKRCAYTL